MTLLPVLPLQAGNKHQKPRRDWLVQEGLIHGPELLPKMILVMPVKRRSIGRYRFASTVIRVRLWLMCHACAMYHELPCPSVLFYGELEGEPIQPEALDPLAEIAAERRSRDTPAMRSDTVGKLLDLGTLRLERAVKRLQEQDHKGAMEDLCAALRHMRQAGADPLSLQHLAAVIADAERRTS